MIKSLKSIPTHTHRDRTRVWNQTKGPIRDVWCTVWCYMMQEQRSVKCYNPDLEWKLQVLDYYLSSLTVLKEIWHHFSDSNCCWIRIRTAKSCLTVQEMLLGGIWLKEWKQSLRETNIQFCRKEKYILTICILLANRLSQLVRRAHLADCHSCWVRAKVRSNQNLNKEKETLTPE